MTHIAVSPLEASPTAEHSPEGEALTERGRRAATVSAAFCAMVGAAATVVAWVYAIRNGDTNPLTGNDGPDLVVPIGFLAVGAVVAARRSRNIVGWLFLGTGVVDGLRSAAAQYAIHGVQTRSTLAGTEWAAWFTRWSLGLVFPAGTLLFILLLFPNGRLLSRRWAIVAGLALAIDLALLFVIVDPAPIMLAPGVPAVRNPLGVHSAVFANRLLSYLWPFAALLLAVSGISTVLRYRRSRGDERQQMKWFAFAVGLALVAFVLALPASFAGSDSNTSFNLAVIGGFGGAIPIACGVAILRYRLYGIDVVISRTLVYGTLAALITLTYVAVATGLGTLVGGGRRPNLALSILATAIVAVGFQPVRERVQRLANRVVYGRRATPYEVLAQFSERVAGSYSVDEVMPRMARVLAEGAGAQRADVWVRHGERWEEAAVWPEVEPVHPAVLGVAGEPPLITGTSRTVPVRHQGELLGALSVTKRAGEQLTPVEENLLNHLAGQAGLVLRNVGLAGDLQARIEELRASRQRLVAAQDRERRRLERNLHDGAQQHLVALKVRLGLAGMLMPRDPQRASETLAQLRSDADQTLETLRDLARGIYPPVLADRGLVEALQAQTGTATVPVVVEAEGVERYSAEVEAAVYFSCLEALQNVQKYAGATQAVIRLSADAERLDFEVVDDGVGFDPAATERGSGLTNIVDRLDALGGAVEIISKPRQGCRLQGSLPVRAALVRAS